VDRGREAKEGWDIRRLVKNRGGSKQVEDPEAMDG
jgi:hypothetical protein